MATFFGRYFCEFDWQRDVVTIRQSERLTKFDKWWLSKPMCIEGKSFYLSLVANNVFFSPLPMKIHLI